MNGRIVDASLAAPSGPQLWEPIIFTKQEIEGEIDRLAALPPPRDGRRESLFVHPQSVSPGLGLAPGIEVRLGVLLPGERTMPVRHNSTQVNFVIGGGGRSVVGGRLLRYERYDVFNVPSFQTYWHLNDTAAPQVRLTYSNAALLEKMGVHLVEPNPPEEPSVPPAADGPEKPSVANPFGTFELDESGAYLMPYEGLISPPVVESRALLWPWRTVKRHLDELAALGTEYTGRRLYLLYNPATGRTNGTTPTFFATMTIRPAGVVDQPHRHVSAAINYYFKGSGYSRVAGRRYEWNAGDLMLSAPGWAIHNHASGPDEVYELTIQDQPLNIAMESLLWQEDLKKPPAVLGSAAGFATNRTAIARR